MISSSDGEKHDSMKLYEVIAAAFEQAYPDVPPERIEHMARNFVQVVGGVIDIGRKLPPESNEPLSHMDVTNSMVFWCIANTRLDEFCEKSVYSGSGGGRRVISAEDAGLLRREFAARIADWLAGVEAIKADADMYDSFIRGTLAMGTADWERSRGELGF